MAAEGATLIEAFLALHERALARVWVDFNLWKWPRDLADFQPPWWDNAVGHDDTKYAFSGPFMDHARARVPNFVVHAEWLARNRVRDTPTKAKSKRKPKEAP